MMSPTVIRCRALVCRGPEQWKVEMIEVDPPKALEVRIKMLYASVCHTDLDCAKGFPFVISSLPRSYVSLITLNYTYMCVCMILPCLLQPLYPRVLGHEGVGVVESVGDEVEELKEGDVVMPLLLGECGECENCTASSTNQCLTLPFHFTGLMPDGTFRLHLPPDSGNDGHRQPLYHLFSCGTWSQYIVAQAHYVLKLNSDIPPPHASFLSCGFSTGFGAAQVEARIDEGSTVAVVGLGAVGLGAVAGARALGAATIIGVDKNDMKREKGEAFGITHFINPDNFTGKAISELVKDLTGGLGVDYCIECTGAPYLINQALESTKVGKGRAIVLGSGAEMDVPISFLALLMGRSLKGSLFGGVKPRTHLPHLLHQCCSSKVSAYNSLNIDRHHGWRAAIELYYDIDHACIVPTPAS
ncbi:hypothetical protein SAY87_008747 [Trapa incisa]|uniref:Alcohol dehydrogenase n=1 Tax=Trapa incisa TaxID=236973 RepID=A0AAN7JYP8_9MYRT|nr:hypothetical protein SAY87_008747 [Trapa incisa]